jgi:hypothetical protein
LYWPRGRIEKNWLNRRVQVTEASTTEVRDSSRKPKSDVVSSPVRWYDIVPSSWLRWFTGCVTRNCTLS